MGQVRKPLWTDETFMNFRYPSKFSIKHQSAKTNSHFLDFVDFLIEASLEDHCLESRLEVRDSGDLKAEKTEWNTELNTGYA